MVQHSIYLLLRDSGIPYPGEVPAEAGRGRRSKAVPGASAGRWDEVLDAEAGPGEASLEPNVQPVSDPRDMVKHGAWMRAQHANARSSR